MAYRYTSSSHQFREQLYQTAQRCHITSSLNQLRNENILCDVTIAVTNRTFPAHKAVLVASSEYFRAMFTSGFQEATQNQVDIRGKAEIFEILLSFIYTGKLQLTLVNAIEVLEMSCYIQLKHASEACSAYLIRAFQGNSIKCVEALQILCLIDWDSGLEELKEWCRHCIAKNFLEIPEILEIPEMLNYEQLITADVMSEILDRSDIAGKEEEVRIYVGGLSLVMDDHNPAVILSSNNCNPVR